MIADRGTSFCAGARRTKRLARAIVFASSCMAASLSHCAPAKPANSVASPVAGPPPAFTYPTIDGRGQLREVALHGHPAVIIFVTTYDLASQAQARYLSTFYRRNRPSVRAAAIMLESEDNRPLMLMFRDTLGLDYPVALGDSEAIAGKGPFGDISVPTTVVLDAGGRVLVRRQGLVTDTEMDELLAGVGKGE